MDIPMKFLISLIGVLASLILSSLATAEAENAGARTILVTGASSGIGLRITEVLSENGYIVYAGARKEEDLKRLEAMNNVESVRLDVTIQSDIDDAVALITEKGRGLYGLVNNAGVVLNGPLIEVPVEELEWLFDVNVYGPYRVTQAFAPMIIESKGRIVNIGSIAGIRSGAIHGLYSMSKHAVEAYTDSLADEMERFDVKASVIEPGSFESNAGTAALARLQEKQYWDKESTSYKADMAFIKSLAKRKKAKNDPVDVANAVKHALFSEAPKRRYLVANERASHSTINKAMEKILQLNQGQPYTMTRDQLVEMLDEQLQNLD